MPRSRRGLIIKIAVGAVIVVAAFAAGLSAKNGLPTAGQAGVAKRSLSVMNLAVGAPQYAATDSFSESAGSYKGASMPPAAPLPDFQNGGQTAAEVDQKIIKNGFLQLTVKDVGGSISRVTSSAGQKGGFVQNSSVTERADGTHSGQITVRVPAKDFETLMSDIKSLATAVKNESSTGQDVTEQYTDLEAQLRNAQAQERTYLAVLDKAKTVEDILNVQERLGQIRGVIESLQGRLKYLENVTSYSTISVSLEEEPAIRLPTKEFRPLSAAKEAVQSLVTLGQNTLIGLIWTMIVGGGLLLPFVLLGLIIALIVKKLRRPKA